jgi:ribosomal-protein-alanine acetyltransferase
MLIQIREASTNNTETLWKIERECFTSEALKQGEILSLLQDSKSTTLIAQINNEIVGFIIGKIYSDGDKLIGHVITLDVVAKHRKKGIGRKLLRTLERKFIDKNVKVCYLEVREDNFPALNLYRKEGYKEIGKLKDYYGYAHGIILKKQLKTPQT